MDQSKKTQLPNGETLVYWQQQPKQQKHDATLVFLHGNFSEHLWWQEQYNDERFKNFRILAVSLRGFGESSYNNKCQGFKDWAQDVIELFKIKEVKKAYVIGWSFGGAIAMKTAQLVPQIVQKVILTCTVGHFGYTNEQNRPRTLEQIIKQLPHLAANIQIRNKGDRQTMKKIFETVLFPFMPDYPVQKKLQLIESPFKQRCYEDLLVAIFNSDIDIQKIKAKGLLIHGAKDAVIVAATLKSTAEHFGGNMEIWEENGHMIPVESIQKYNARILVFFNEQNSS